MKAIITTTIVTTIDIETMKPSHAVDVQTDDELPRNLVMAAAIGGCNTAAAALEKEGN